ncbi:MAG: nicotinamide-nucleotide adenylyltransferase [Archaeoglobus sp.]|nr:nicotinamide-nucleotide adenylyltransferase [Archaeoglobus sp.]
MESRALIFGRFQPFHLGHLKVVEWALDDFDELVILIGMADESHTLRNPFTAGERIWMIREALKSEGVDLSRIITATAPTMNIYVGNAYYIIKLVPEIKTLITRNPVIGQVFRGAGVEVVEPPTFNREIYRGKVIRERILKGEEWENLVPKRVAEIINKIGGVERIRVAGCRD